MVKIALCGEGLSRLRTVGFDTTARRTPPVNLRLPSMPTDNPTVDAPDAADGIPESIRPCRVLVCALDWGLGHAARTTPLVREFLRRGSQVVLASNGRSADFWRSEFPELKLRGLPDYGVRYAPGPWLVPGILASLPRLFRAISGERKSLASWRRDGFDLVLSDNRYGCRIPGVRSILLTHQLRLAAPSGLGGIEGAGEWMMSRFVRSFSEIWIPDRSQGLVLSGRLGHPAHPEHFPPLRYIGPQSRFASGARDPAWAGPWDSVGLVSGPEPSRTKFENQLRARFRDRPGRHLLVRGRPDLAPIEVPSADFLVEVPHLPTPALAAAFSGAQQIVSRGGYSTVMDLDALGLLGERCLFCPTPGQTEQETLARELSARGACAMLRENDLA
jgi:hypothetical protein